MVVQVLERKVSILPPSTVVSFDCYWPFLYYSYIQFGKLSEKGQQKYSLYLHARSTSQADLY